MTATLALVVLLAAQIEAPLDGQASGVDRARCLEAARAGGGALAAACYRAQARAHGEALSDDERRALDGLIDAALSLELAPADAHHAVLPPTVTDAPPPRPFSPFDLTTLIFSGKGELIATSTLAGAAGALMAYAGVLSLGPPADGSGPLIAAVGLLSPLAGGAIGLGASAAAVAFVPALSPGRAHTIRAFELLGGFNSAALPFTLATFRVYENNETLMRLLPFQMLVILAAHTGAGVGVAFLDLPEETGPMALTGATWGAVLGAVLYGASDPQRPDSVIQLARLVFVGGNGGFVLAGVAAQVFPIKRLETWAMDVGGALGGLGALGLAAQLHAPNPQIGWGSVAGGVIGGMTAGFLLARAAPGWLAAVPDMPELVAVGPAAQPNGRGGADLVVAARLSLP